ncbi:hypothetical protein E1B28_013064 [Marasmius oreades]|uniref:Uncharacterized protein n=1 Tax=Marasmius oreades TaxID=181124 RepID=A0A9P7RPH3_9AGAR|nr:uncharacterized protein E1B28_013064 [Marasmius oreades]KAG7087082.1 hypothetical protein E1B28_013064 [Marasmius oreades]
MTPRSPDRRGSRPVKENLVPTASHKCKHKSTQKASETAAEQAKRKEKKRREKEERRWKKAEKRETVMLIHSDDDEDTRNLKRMLQEATNSAQAATQALQALEDEASKTSEPKHRDIPPPKAISYMKIIDLRDVLGLSGPEHNAEWNFIRNITRKYVERGWLDDKLDFKSQNKQKLAKVYNAIENECSALATLKNNWGSQMLVHSFFQHSKTYSRTNKTLGTYRYHKRME